MAKISTVKCDAKGCSAVKQASNHWHTYFVFRSEGRIVAHGAAVDGHALTIKAKRGRSVTDYELTKHDLCGDGCVAKFVSSLTEKPIEFPVA